MTEHLQLVHRGTGGSANAFDPLGYCLMALCILLNPSANAHILEGTDWKTQSQKGFIALEQNDIDGACRYYERALSLLDNQVPEPVKLDLELDLVRALVSKGDYSQAGARLAEMKSTLTAKYSGSLLEARFWRRYRSVCEGERKYHEALSCQRHVSAILGSRLGTDCPAAVKEELRLLGLQTQCRDWFGGFRVAGHIESLLPISSPEEAKVYRVFIDTFVQSFFSSIDSLAVTDPAAALKVAETFRRCLPDDPRLTLSYLKLSNNLPSVDAQRQARNAAIDIFRQKRTPLSLKDRQLLAMLLLGRACPAITGANPVSRNTLEDIRDADLIVDQTVPPAERGTVALYLQVKSMMACALAKTGSPKQSSNILDRLHPCPRVYQHLHSLSGIFQARVETARAFVAQRDLISAKQQFRSIYDLIDAVSGPDRGHYLFMFEAQENRLLGPTEKTMARDALSR